MRTLDRRSVYLRGLAVGGTLGLFLGAFLAASFGGPTLRAPQVPAPLDLAVAAGVGLLAGLALGLGGAAVVATLASGEGREQAREGAAPAIFPGMFGEPTADPFAPIKARIDAEEPPGEEPRPPESMPESCPACGERLEPGEPTAFCYHCGASLA